MFPTNKKKGTELKFKQSIDLTTKWYQQFVKPEKMASPLACAKPIHVISTE